MTSWSTASRAPCLTRLWSWPSRWTLRPSLSLSSCLGSRCSSSSFRPPFSSSRRWARPRARPQCSRPSTRGSRVSSSAATSSSALTAPQHETWRPECPRLAAAHPATHRSGTPPRRLRAVRPLGPSGERPRRADASTGRGEGAATVSAPWRRPKVADPTAFDLTPQAPRATSCQRWPRTRRCASTCTRSTRISAPTRRSATCSASLSSRTGTCGRSTSPHRYPSSSPVAQTTTRPRPRPPPPPPTTSSLPPPRPPTRRARGCGVSRRCTPSTRRSPTTRGCRTPWR